ncbi:hypothetical protein [Rhizobium sullae]|uniref:hypothetical protein n=1 Tax=Rhizobium sullae TaxID=50338 RepID=UPI000B36381E|nr:hypothetical protein [Rhizobium sullae]
MIAFVGCVLGMTCLGSALSGFLLDSATSWERALLVVAAIVLVVQEPISSLIGLALMLPVAANQLLSWKKPACCPVNPARTIRRAAKRPLKLDSAMSNRADLFRPERSVLGGRPT